MIETFLTCPVCPDEHEDVHLAADGEHIAVWCHHCQSLVKVHHHEFERMPSMPRTPPRGDR